VAYKRFINTRLLTFNVCGVDQEFAAVGFQKLDVL